MFNVKKEELIFGGKKLVLESGKIARQADASVLVTYGETVVLCTVVYKKSVSNDVSYFPLNVNYIEKSYASGKILGGFNKREGKSSEKEILTSRLIDRPMRPIFPVDFFHDVQVICTVMSYDGENDPDIVALIGASAAIKLAGLPVTKTIAATKIAYIDGAFVVNPSNVQLANKENKLNLIVSGSKDAILMVESEAYELSEKEMLDAILLAQKEFSVVIDAIEKMSKDVKQFEYTPVSIPNEMKDLISKEFFGKIQAAYQLKDKLPRYEALSAIKADAIDQFSSEEVSQFKVECYLSELQECVVRSMVIKDKTRIDGRGEDDIRQIAIELGFLPRTHGSVLFTRGETQAIVTVTLGNASEGQLVEDIDEVKKEKFMLHYNFPPFCVGESGAMRGPGRREIGHGKLAFKAINPMLDLDSCDYAVRVVSEITESNGSSSMASVCGASLALMDAGIKLKKPVAGIAMGLIKETEGFSVLTDIMGDEDFLGDMDFKVAGTKEGITALQMDIKIDGISREIMEIALEKAQKARFKLLDIMGNSIAAARDSVGKYAPKIEKFHIPVKSIGDAIGKGGATIKGMCEKFGVKIDISDEGEVSVYGVDADLLLKAKEEVLLNTLDLEFNKVYRVEIVDIKPFGAMAKIGNKSGLIHISEIAEERVEKVEDYLKLNDIVDAKYIGLDEKRRAKFSIKKITSDISKKTSSKETDNDVVDLDLVSVGYI